MAKEEKEEAVYTMPTSQVDLEARLGDESDPPVFLPMQNPNPFHEDGYVGVSPEYANAANETDEPLQAEEGPDAAAEEAFEAAYGDSSGEVSDQAKAVHEQVATTFPDDSTETTETKATTTKKTAAKSTSSS